MNKIEWVGKYKIIIKPYRKMSPNAKFYELEVMRIEFWYRGSNMRIHYNLAQSIKELKKLAHAAIAKEMGEAIVDTAISDRPSLVFRAEIEESVTDWND